MNINFKRFFTLLGALGASWCVSNFDPIRYYSPGLFKARLTHAEEIPNKNKAGLGAYAAMSSNWPCNKMMNGFEGVDELRLSVLWNTFGNNFSCLYRYASDPRPKMLQVHLINEVCQRNKRCGKYEVLYGMTVEEYRKKLKAKDKKLITKIKQNIAPVSQFFVTNPEVKCYLSAGLESNLPSKLYKELVDELKPNFPDRCQWVWSPVGNNPYGNNPIKNFIYEGHGDAPRKVNPPCIVNLDGVDIDLKSRSAILPQKVNVSALPRFLASFASCEASFLWIAEFNGIGRGGFIDPRKRNNWPSDKIMKELSPYMKMPISLETQPPWNTSDDLGKKGCKKFLKINDGEKKDFLWKQSDPPVLNRGAVAFLPRKYNTLNIKPSQVFVMKAEKKVAVSYERSRYTEDGSNRQFFRFHKKAENFPFNVVLHFGNLCAVIPNPKNRND